MRNFVVFADIREMDVGAKTPEADEMAKVLQQKPSASDVMVPVDVVDIHNIGTRPKIYLPLLMRTTFT